MNFIELFFELSPDNNTGTTEAAIFFSLFVGLNFLYVWLRSKSARRRGSSF